MQKLVKRHEPTRPLPAVAKPEGVLCYYRNMTSLKKLNTPAKIQDYLNSIPFNFEKKGESISSPLETIKKNSAHCFEGALLGAYLLSKIGHKPQILYLKSTEQDYDHVITPFKVDGLWGALSKTNHPVLRYREPVYKNIRELVMSYFHEYFLNDGTKTLRQYSELLDLNKYGNWIDSDEDLWGIDEDLDSLKHYDIVPKGYITKLRKADRLECKAAEVVEYK